MLGASSSGVSALNAWSVQIPQELLDDPALQKAIAVLPSNYNFEIEKTVLY